MKKVILAILLSINPITASQIKYLKVDKKELTLITQPYDIYDSEGELVKFYVEQKNNDLDFLFSLILEDRTGSCADKSMEDGHYEINGSSITLYSSWKRTGNANDSPYGGRIQVFKVNDKEIAKVSSQLYIETQRKNYNEESGMKYLFNPPTNEKQIEALHTYIKMVEQKFHGKFVQGDEAKRLLKEVKEAMMRKKRSRWN